MYISTTPLNCLTLKTPSLVQIRSSISCISRVLANFVFENHQLVGYHGNEGRSEANFDDAVKLPDHENPLFGANGLLLSLKITSYCRSMLP